MFQSWCRAVDRDGSSSAGVAKLDCLLSVHSHFTHSSSHFTHSSLNSSLTLYSQFLVRVSAVVVSFYPQTVQCSQSLPTTTPKNGWSVCCAAREACLRLSDPCLGCSLHDRSFCDAGLDRPRCGESFPKGGSKGASKGGSTSDSQKLHAARDAWRVAEKHRWSRQAKGRSPQAVATAQWPCTRFHAPQGASDPGRSNLAYLPRIAPSCFVGVASLLNICGEKSQGMVGQALVRNPRDE